jgi:preprotein translocase subunit SecB
MVGERLEWTPFIPNKYLLRPLLKFAPTVKRESFQPAVTVDEVDFAAMEAEIVRQKRKRRKKQDEEILFLL